MVLRVFLAVALLIASLPSIAQESVEFKQLYVGFNGPAAPERLAITSQKQLEDSWIASALGADAPSVIAQVDFAHQVLVAVAVGERETNTGNVKVSDVMKLGDGIATFVQVGVNEKSCKQPHQPSFPFVLVLIERPAQFDPESGGYDLQNFADGCKQVPKGSAAPSTSPST